MKKNRTRRTKKSNKVRFEQSPPRQITERQADSQRLNQNAGEVPA